MKKRDELNHQDKLIQRITSDLETIEEAYQRVRFQALTPEQQKLYATHIQDQFDAVPPYIERHRTKGERG